MFGVFCREQARAIAATNDVRVLAFTPRTDVGPRALPPLGGPGRAGADDATGLPPPARARRGDGTQLAGMEAVLRTFRRSGWTPDVIHAHVFEAGFPAVLLGRRLGRPVVVSEHFTAFQRDLVRRRRPAARAPLLPPRGPRCPVSEDLRRQLEVVQPRGRYRVVPNVVDTTFFHPPAEPRPSLQGRPVRLLNVASLDEKKRHADLLHALAAARPRGVDAGSRSSARARSTASCGR